MHIISSLFTVFAALVLPVGAAVWLAAKKRGYIKPVLLGAMTFVLFQGVRMTLNELVLSPLPSMTLLSMTRPVLYYLFFALTAGLFEEGGRWIVMRLFLRDRTRLADGVAFGIGHGGIEAVLLTGVNALAILLMGSVAVPAGEMFAGGVERILAMISHIGFSVMVQRAVVQKRPLWLLLAFLLHTLLDAGLVLKVYGASMFQIEAFVGVFALGMLGFLVAQSKKFKGGMIQ